MLHVNSLEEMQKWLIILHDFPDVMRLVSKLSVI